MRSLLLNIATTDLPINAEIWVVYGDVQPALKERTRKKGTVRRLYLSEYDDSDETTSTVSIPPVSIRMFRVIHQSGTFRLNKLENKTGVQTIYWM
ncbi:31310_t:CDS:2, partial [Racocetra persica]